MTYYTNVNVHEHVITNEVPILISLSYIYIAMIFNFHIHTFT